MGVLASRERVVVVSFCRWSSACEDGRVSDLYVFDHVDGYLTCFSCVWSAADDSGRSNGPDWTTLTPRDMAAHMRRHAQAGHAVPERAIVKVAAYVMKSCP
jgi:hypothetical protein